jgi:membrane-bound lytic murein transglycosylase D
VSRIPTLSRLLLMPLALALALVLALRAAPLHAAAERLPRPAELQKDVDFWIRVYSEITTSEGFLHDEQDLGIIYRKLKFRPDVKSAGRREAIDAERRNIQSMLERLADGTATPTDSEKAIAQAFGAAASPARYRQAAEGVRFQLGQADRFREGLLRSGTWEGHIADTFANLGLPPELAALPHVESSFDPTAYSKVGAAGLWQFMRGTGRRFLRIDDAVDERMDPFRSTEAAAQLLDYNYRLLGSWPLALTAYNHGAEGMRRARDATGTTDIAYIVRNYRSRSFGFASRNFYVSFLAALEIDRHPEKYFGAITRNPEMHFTEVALPAYVPFTALSKTVQVDRVRLAELNPALRPPVLEGSRLVPKGYRLRLPPQQVEWTPELLAARLGPDVQYVGQPVARSYRVKKGDTMGRIAANQRVDVDVLARLNRLPVDASLKTGRVLTLPVQPARLVSAAANDAGPAPAVAVPDPARSAPAGAESPRFYVVRAGDSLASISARVSVPQSRIVALNNIRNPDSIYEGQRLRLTEASPAAVAASEQQADEALTERIAESRAAAAAADARESGPVSVAEEEGPSLGPGGAVPQASDPIDYSVAANGTVRVSAAETLGHYADWLGVSAANLRKLNNLQSSGIVALGRPVKLDFSRVTREQFEQRRRAYHQTLQAEFFAGHRIVGTDVVVARRGDSLWSVTQRHARVPAWLLQQYNPDIDFSVLQAGIEIVVPKVESLPEV